MGIFQRNSANAGSDKKKVEVAEVADATIGIPFLSKEPKLLKPDTSHYGIDEVIALMNKLPEGDLDTVVTVVKHTLESLDVEVTHIIADAEDKMQSISAQLKILMSEILQFQEDIKSRQNQITILEEELRNTEQVKKDLLHAEKLNTPAAKNKRTENSIETQTAAQLKSKSSGDAASNTPNIGDNEYDDGIPVVEAIDLDNHNLGESFRESIRKSKSKVRKQAVTS